MKVKVISLPYIFQVLYVLCFTRPRYQVSIYRTMGPLVHMYMTIIFKHLLLRNSWPIKAKFYVEPPWEGGTNFCI